jgi:hypothetical protein
MNKDGPLDGRKTTIIIKAAKRRKEAKSHRKNI